jgi:hypothetical protein
MSYVHWQYQTAPGHPQSLTLDDFAQLGPDDLRGLLGVLSVEEKIKLLAVSPRALIMVPKKKSRIAEEFTLPL